MPEDNITIITNHHRRPIVCWYELSEKDQQSFGYDIEGESFFWYKGQFHNLSDFMAISEPLAQDIPELKKWHGIASDTFFSGLLVLYDNNCDEVIVGRFYA